MNRTRHLLVPFVVVALAVGAWWTLSRTATLHQPTHVAEASTAASGQPDDSAVRTRAMSRATRIATRPFAPETEPAADAEAGALEDVEVLVIGADNACAPHATVTWFDTGVLDERASRASWRLPPVLEELAARVGHSVVADDTGRAVLPGRLDRGLIHAHLGDFAGVRTLNGSPPYFITLSPTQSLQVQVVDAAGEAVPDQPVVLRLDGSTAIATARTSGTRGLATFPQIDQQLAAAQLLHSVMTPTFSVALPIPGCDSSSPIYSHRLPTEPVILTLPATGRVVVNLRDPSGAIAVGPVSVALTVAADDHPGSLCLDDNDSRQPAVDGCAVFPHVALAQRYSVQARRDGAKWTAFQQFDGPGQSGAVVTVELVMTPIESIVVGRLVDPAGGVCAACSIHMAVRWPSRAGPRFTNEAVTTDAAGRWSLTLPCDQAGSAPDAPGQLTILELRAADDTSRRPLRAARVNLPGALPPGETDIGDVTFAPPPIVLSGTVVDDADHRVGGASIDVTWLSGERTHWSPTGEVQIETSDSDYVSAPDGTFEIRSFETVSPLRVTASGDGFLGGEPVTCPRGTRDVVVHVVRSGFLVGSVLLDEGIPPRAVLLSVTSPAIDQRARRREVMSEATVSATGEFYTGELPIGPATVAVRILGNPDPLLVVAGVAIKAGDATHDARLDRIDLRGKIRTVNITVVDAEGGSVCSPTVFVDTGTAQEHEVGRTWFSVSGTVAFFLGLHPVDLVVEAPGFRRVVARAVTADRMIVLPPALKVRVHIAGAMPGLSESAELAVALARDLTAPDEVFVGRRFTSRRIFIEGGAIESRWPQDPTADRITHEATVGEDGTATLAVATHGRYRATLVVHGRLANGEGGSATLDLPPTTLTITDTDGEQLVTLPAASQQAVDAAIKRLR